MAKYAMLREAIAQHFPAVELLAVPVASDGELALVHTPEYIETLVNGQISAAAMREIGFPWSEFIVARARRSVGATVAAVRATLQSGVAANLAGGTHHAYASKGGGFCVFNDVAVAVRLAQSEWQLQHRQPLKVAVIDLDVALADGCGDADCLAALEQALLELGQRFEPRLVLYLAGADPYLGDRLGRLALTRDGLEARDQRVFDWCHRRRIPVAFVMAGGYGKQIEETVQIQCRTFQLGLAYAQRWQQHPGQQVGLDV